MCWQCPLRSKCELLWSADHMVTQSLWVTKSVPICFKSSMINTHNKNPNIKVARRYEAGDFPQLQNDHSAIILVQKVSWWRTLVNFERNQVEWVILPFKQTVHTQQGYKISRWWRHYQTIPSGLYRVFVICMCKESLFYNSFLCEKWILANISKDCQYTKTQAWQSKGF